MSKPKSFRNNRAKLVRGDGTKITPIKNLGWLRNNWQQVEYFEIHKSTDPNMACMMRAFLRGSFSGYYETNWASYNMCLDWLNRPIFRTLDLSVMGNYLSKALPLDNGGREAGIKRAIGAPGYNDLKEAE